MGEVCRQQFATGRGAFVGWSQVLIGLALVVLLGVGLAACGGADGAAETTATATASTEAAASISTATEATASATASTEAAPLGNDLDSARTINAVVGGVDG